MGLFFNAASMMPGGDTEHGRLTNMVGLFKAVDPNSTMRVTLPDPKASASGVNTSLSPPTQNNDYVTKDKIDVSGASGLSLAPLGRRGLKNPTTLLGG